MSKRRQRAGRGEGEDNTHMRAVEPEIKFRKTYSGDV
jgi:hypothetical protein